ncbi:MAG: SLBB domain-containing protein [Sphaerochaetaceae bacterium]|nr:SLBB domain-containing protein [Sphaerochaetaceae bacterium]
MDRRFKVLITIMLLLLPLWVIGAASPLIVRSPWFETPQSSVDVLKKTDIQHTSLASQLGLPEEPVPIPAREERTLAAIANQQYPVTPGDTLSLTYVEGKTTVSLTLQVGGDWRVSIPNFGAVDGKTKTFSQLSKDIEVLVSTYLPFSSPRVSLISTGSFSVLVKGEVYTSQEVQAWGLSRLSSVVFAATPYASSRNVLVTSADGKTTGYDVYKALRDGDISQNPLIRSGDVIEFTKAERIVSLGGSVARPGINQLKAGETLNELLVGYGGGLLAGADSNVLIERKGKTTDTAFQVMRHDASKASSFTLQHMDSVRVEAIVAATPAVTVEGAIAVTEQQSLSSIPASSGRLLYQFFPDETLQSMIIALSDRFTTTTDLSQTYLQRDGSLIPIDAQAILAGVNVQGADTRLKAGDKLVVPFSQMFVTVSGGVLKPGVYPYIPGKQASYYINLAGGFDPEKNRNEKFSMTDKHGEKLDKDASVTPETVIAAALNTFNATNGQTLATTVTIVGLVATILSIVLNVMTISSKL